MQGLAYAFLSAGVKCVLASRLEVGDINTPKIMDSFYNNILKENQSVQKAFQLTLQDFYDPNNQNEGLTKDLASWTIYT